MAGGILWEIEKACWDHMRENYQTPTEITMSRKAYETLIRDACGWVFLKAEEDNSGLLRVTEEKVCGMKINVVDETDGGFFSVGGTVRTLRGGQENVQGTD